MDYYTKRAYTRHSMETPIIVVTAKDNALFGSEMWDYQPARMYNIDKGGMYFEADRPFEPGSNISIRMTDSLPGDDIGQDAYKVHYGKVRWCKEIHRAEGPGYGVGIRILETVLQAPVLTSRL